jgi:hypothetical protein
MFTFSLNLTLLFRKQFVLETLLSTSENFLGSMVVLLLDALQLLMLFVRVLMRLESNPFLLIKTQKKTPGLQSASELYRPSDRLCGLEVRVPGYRSGTPGFDSRRYQIF